MGTTPISPVEDLKSLVGPVFICGGAYCGKSLLAHQSIDPEKPAAIVGTAIMVPDEPFKARLAELKAARPPHWETFESIVDLVPLVEELCSQYPQVVVDSMNQHIAACLVTRLDHYDRLQIEEQLTLEMQQFATSVANKSGDTRLVIVSGDVSAGVPPQRSPARAYRKLLGQTNTLIAGACKSVVDVRYGIPLQIK